MLVFAILLSSLCLLPASAEKAQIKRSIAIVFDNSGSMYLKGEKAWCRATYAMEVFASMLNVGDTLLIHPMSPITVGGSEYTMDKPFIISDPSQASKIREIYTNEASATYIETIDAAVKGLATTQADKKYMIVLTDGQAFYENDVELSAEATRTKLGEKFSQYIGPDLNILYLGIGSKVAMPEFTSEYYMGKKAADSKDVLSTLTEMCNRIFARDTLPSSHMKGSTINFDISMSKLIVFVQGENVSDVKITGKNGGTATLMSTAATKYSEQGAGNYKKSGQSPVDKTLQGMIVTYSDCSAGEYDISYSGSASNVEIYYEPDADLNFIFTDSQGNLVDPSALHKGEYKVQYGLKDAKTGELISSDLLGNPSYIGTYTLNGKEYPIQASGYSGEEPISLDVGDTFTAVLTASYLNGYSIKKDAKDFGWPDGQIVVVAKPAGDLRLEITDGDSVYDLKKLEQSGTYTAKVFYKGNQLTGTELEKVDLRWEPEKSNAEIKQTFKDDHFDLSLHYKNPSDPLSTVCGKCTVTIDAHYTEDGSTETVGSAPLTYVIEDQIVVPELMLSVPQKHFLISKIDEGKAIKVYVTSNGVKLTPEEFADIELKVDSQGLGYEIIPLADESAFEIKLNSTGTLSRGKYRITAVVDQTDNLGRVMTDEGSCKIKLSNLPLWLEWLLLILLIIVLVAILYFVSHIRCLPTKLHANKRDCEMVVGGEDVSKNTAFLAAIEGGVLSVEAKYAGMKTGVKMSVTPGTDSYLMTKQVKRKAMVAVASVKKSGSATIEDVNVGNRKYIFNEQTYKLEPALNGAKDFDLSNGNTIVYSGTMQRNGVNEPFYVRIKLDYKKKK